ncbi:MAG: flagellar M-ring protein FliF [Pseudomonadota bacterium]|nr:flagellar M-ring protein FliF [Pseudomonadota bacterium]
MGFHKDFPGAGMRQFFTSMSRRSRIAFVAGLLMIACVIGGATWWITHPPYGVLFGELRESDAAEITAALSQMQVPYRLADEGKTILVPAEQVYGTRMKLVSQGVPKGGSVGFELFKDSDYGVTEFAQKVNFQRALQGELERTISSLSEVESARVHLTIHHPSLFERGQETSKASVTLNLRPHKRLDAREVVGIQRLVASAVEELKPDSVVVLDGKGLVLSGYAADGPGEASIGDRLDEQTRIETGLRKRVGQMLHRVLLADDFTVSVNVRLNYDRVKQVSERLLAQGKDGNGLLVREKTDVTGHVIDSSDPDHVRTGPTSNGREVEYAHGHEQEEVDRAPGRIERISVGIVIPSTLPRAEIEKLSAVVSAGLGLDPSRGDKVDIAAIALPERVAAVVPAPVPGAVSPTSTGTHATETEPARSPARVAWWAYPSVAALVAIILASLFKASRNVPRRLLPSEREETLARLHQWIESAEVER